MLSVKGLAVSIDQKLILKRTNLEVANGEVLAILGRSGSGKSTLLKAIAGLLEPQNGTIFVDKERVKKPSEQLIAGHKSIKIVRQDNPLFPNISLAENIAYPLRFFQKPYQEARVKKLLKLTGLSKIANQKPKNVSEGEQQRAVIAAALADEPKVLLLDEPFSNLDFANKQRLKNEIREIISSENMACIFVTHDISDVFGNADRLAIIKQGKIVQIGDAQEVYIKPKSKYVAQIAGQLNKHSSFVFGQRGTFFYSRPQHIVLNENGEFIAQVVTSIFRGNFWEIILSKNGENFSSFQLNRAVDGQEINFNITNPLFF
jgi:ABC-type Fe3+/spermidine/putrescine transport system ATPase subunit